MDQPAAEEATWGSIDNNLQSCVLLHLEPRDLAHVSLASRALASRAEADVVWATLFLRRFGSDFWGEHVGPHPYHEVAPRPPNEWLRLPAVSVFEEFMHGRGGASSADHGNFNDEARNDLLTFVKETEHTAGTGGWKLAYKRMSDMVHAWRSKCAAAVLVAGETSFPDLRAITDIIKEGIFAHKLRYRPPRNDKLPLSPVPASTDVSSPANNARVLRIVVPRTQWEQPYVLNFCAVRRPRNWWNRRPKAGGRIEGEEAPLHFRGLQVEPNEMWIDRTSFQRLYLVYAINCERMAEPDYQEQVFKELHGLLGEGKDQFYSGLFVNLHLINAPLDFGPERILERLKIPKIVEPEHRCPYYAGPVVFVVTAFTMPHDTGEGEPAEEKEKREELILNSLRWLMEQPMAGQPQAGVFRQENLWLCALSDKRGEAERVDGITARTRPV